MSELSSRFHQLCGSSRERDHKIERFIHAKIYYSVMYICPIQNSHFFQIRRSCGNHDADTDMTLAMRPICTIETRDESSTYAKWKNSRKTTSDIQMLCIRVRSRYDDDERKSINFRNANDVDTHLSLHNQSDCQCN